MNIGVPFEVDCFIALGWLIVKILAVAGDAGGARALEPVVRRLRSTPGMEVECRAFAAASEIWEKAGFRPVPCNFLEVRGFNRIILGGTVGSEQYELEVIRQARTLKIRTVSVLDFWSHYRERFTTHEGAFVLPDAIAVMDAQACQDMIALGFPRECLHVTGHPVFDELARYDGSEAKNQAGLRLRQLVGRPSDERCILYASQPLSQLFSREALGFLEDEVLQDIIASLGRVLDRQSKRASLLVKLHPREMGKPYPLPPSPSPNLSVVLVGRDGIEPREMAVGSDLVIGMNSMLLMEACLLKRPVVSYQPGLRIEDPLPSNRMNWSRGVYSRQELDGALEKELFDLKTRQDRECLLSEIPPTNGATERVIALLLSY